MFQTCERLDIGKHNYLALRKIFWRNNILIEGEHTGGSISATMRLDIGGGRVAVGNHRVHQVAI